MADGIGSGVKAAKGFVVNHYLAFGVLALVLVSLALSYDHKNNGALSQKLAKLPILGSLFS
jgi:hypothetical protein